MKTEFDMLSTFNSGGDAFVFPVMAADDEAYINQMHYGDNKWSFQDLLNLCIIHEEQQKPLLPLLPSQLLMNAGGSSSFYCLPHGISPPIPLPENVAVFGSFDAVPDCLVRSLDGGEDLMELLKLKLLMNQEFSNQFGAYGGYDYNSGSISMDPSSFFYVSGGFGFRRLPDLRSLENQQPVPMIADFGYRSPPQNIDDGSSLHYVPEKSGRNYLPPPTHRHHPYKEPPATAEAPKALKEESRSRKLARERRQAYTEKTRILRKLMPWKTKMDTATMLQEACKYVKFLQAQVRVLETMPDRGALSSLNPSSAAVTWPLASLSRQQALEAVVNSPAAQTFLYSRGCCVYSVEQLSQLRMVIDRKALIEQMLIASASIYAPKVL